METNEVRTVEYLGNPLRVVGCGADTKISVSDIAKSIGLASGRVTRFNYQSDDLKVPTKGGNQSIKVMKITDAISMLFRSRRRGAEDMANWAINTLLMEQANG